MIKDIKLFAFSIVFALILSFMMRQLVEVSITVNVIASIAFVMIGSLIGKKLFSREK